MTGKTNEFKKLALLAKKKKLICRAIFYLRTNGADKK